MAFSLTASAITVTLDASSPYYLGSATPGTPAGDAAETTYVDALRLRGTAGSFSVDYGQPLGVQSYVRTSNYLGTLGSVAPAFSDKNNSPTYGTYAIDGLDYILLKFGQGQGDQKSYVFYVGGLADSDLFQIGTSLNSGTGLSHISSFGNRVPDGGASLLLLGAALTALAFFRRKLS
jgi:hypothetical protein